MSHAIGECVFGACADDNGPAKPAHPDHFAVRLQNLSFLARLNNVHGDLLSALVLASTNVKVFVKVFNTSLFTNLITDLIHL